MEPLQRGLRAKKRWMLTFYCCVVLVGFMSVFQTSSVAEVPGLRADVQVKPRDITGSVMAANTVRSSGRRRAHRTVYDRVSSGDTLTTNSYITPEDQLVSQNGLFHANLSTNGVFRVFKRDSYSGERVMYELGAPPMVQTQMGVRPGRREPGDFHAILLSDGNLQIQMGTDPRNKLGVVESSNHKSKQRGQYRAVMQNDGCFMVYNSTGHPLWWSNPVTLMAREFLEVGDALIAANGKHFAILHNSSFATYEGYGPSDPEKKMTFEWKLRPHKLPKKNSRLFAMILETGDFQIFSARSPTDNIKKIAIRSNTGGNKAQPMDNFFGYMQDDGEFVVYGGQGRDISQFQKLWSNFEACKSNVEETLHNMVKNIPIIGLLWKETSALAYSLKPWCSQLARERMMDGVKSVGSSIVAAVVPLGFRLYHNIKEKGWRKTLRVKEDAEDTTHYEVLGVDRDASPDEIRKAYIKLSTTYHPDKYHQDREKSKEVEVIYKKMTMASEILLDEQKRYQYDNELPMFDFSGTKNFFGTLGNAFVNWLGITNELKTSEFKEAFEGLDQGLE